MMGPTNILLINRHICVNSITYCKWNRCFLPFCNYIDFIEEHCLETERIQLMYSSTGYLPVGCNVVFRFLHSELESFSPLALGGTCVLQKPIISQTSQQTFNNYACDKSLGQLLLLIRPIRGIGATLLHLYLLENTTEKLNGWLIIRKGSSRVWGLNVTWIKCPTLIIKMYLIRFPV